MRRIRVLGSQQNNREYLHEALQIAASGKVKVMTET
jgi:D-arabinose 1-dehydrogenase-like Zn-dependent alcohol dehydrogenase